MDLRQIKSILLLKDKLEEKITLMFLTIKPEIRGIELIE